MPPLDPVARKKYDEALADEAIAKQRLAAANARKAEIEANAAAARAAIGVVAEPPANRGSIKLGTDAGKGEATLLAAAAIGRAASAIAGTIKPLVAGKTVHVFAGTERPVSRSSGQFELSISLLKAAFDSAAAALQEARRLAQWKGTETESAAALTIASAAVGAVTQLGQYFQSEYNFTDVALASDDGLLASAVAGELCRPGGAAAVLMPAIYSGPGGAANLQSALTEAGTRAATAVAHAAEAGLWAARLEADVEAAQSNDRHILTEKAAAYRSAEALAKSALDDFRTFSAKLTTADAEGRLPLAQIADELRMTEALNNDDACVLFLKVSSQVGALYTKSNLWTFLGGSPAVVMGGAVVTFTLVEGRTGKLAASGMLPVHGGHRGVTWKRRFFGRTDEGLHRSDEDRPGQSPIVAAGPAGEA